MFPKKINIRKPRSKKSGGNTFTGTTEVDY